MEWPVSEQIEKDISLIEDYCKQARVYLEQLKKEKDPENAKQIVLNISLEMLHIKRKGNTF